MNFSLMKLNLHLMSQNKQENIQKKLQGCISKGEGGASLDVPVMSKFADCKVCFNYLYLSMDPKIKVGEH